MSQVLISGLVSTNQVNRWSARNIRPVNSSWSLSYIYGGRFGTKRLLKILSGKKYLPSTWIRVPEKKIFISSVFFRVWLSNYARRRKRNRTDWFLFLFCFYILKKICWRFLAVFKRNCTGRVRTIYRVQNIRKTSPGGHSECKHTFLQSHKLCKD